MTAQSIDHHHHTAYTGMYIQLKHTWTDISILVEGQTPEIVALTSIPIYIIATDADTLTAASITTRAGQIIHTTKATKEQSKAHVYRSVQLIVCMIMSTLLKVVTEYKTHGHSEADLSPMIWLQLTPHLHQCSRLNYSTMCTCTQEGGGGGGGDKIQRLYWTTYMYSPSWIAFTNPTSFHTISHAIITRTRILNG